MKNKFFTYFIPFCLSDKDKFTDLFVCIEGKNIKETTKRFSEILLFQNSFEVLVRCKNFYWCSIRGNGCNFPYIPKDFDDHNRIGGGKYNLVYDSAVYYKEFFDSSLCSKEHDYGIIIYYANGLIKRHKLSSNIDWETGELINCNDKLLRGNQISIYDI